MNNEPTIEQMNEAISLFMELHKNGEWHNHPVHTGIGGYRIHEMQYHSSWDWLMPVWKRIIDAVFGLTEDGDYPVDFNAIMDMYAYHCEQVDIPAAHDIVYKAIQWYNNQSTTTNEA